MVPRRLQYRRHSVGSRRRLPLGGFLIPAPDRIDLATPPELDSCKSHLSAAEATHNDSLVLGNRRRSRFNQFWSWYKSCHRRRAYVAEHGHRRHQRGAAGPTTAISSSRSTITRGFESRPDHSKPFADCDGPWRLTAACFTELRRRYLARLGTGQDQLLFKSEVSRAHHF
jgi:hypothetical protein